MTAARAARITAFLAQPVLARLLGALNGEGQETRVVGGAIRNLLLGEAISDIDLATTALPKETARRGRAAGFKSVPTGIEHGTITLVGDGASFEVTTLRQDVETDGRRATVVFGRDFAQDALRRDFTINAMAREVLPDGGLSDVLIDPYGGKRDLDARQFRHVGEAFAEDPVRILRCARFAARFTDFTVADETLALMRRTRLDV